MPSMYMSLRIPQSDRRFWEKLEHYAEMEKTTLSAIVRAAVREYVKNHGEGNPQTPLLPERPEFHNLPREQRQDMVEQFIDFYDASPTKPLRKCIMQFAKVKGLREKTVVDYAKMLAEAGILKKH